MRSLNSLDDRATISSSGKQAFLFDFELSLSLRAFSFVNEVSNVRFLQYRHLGANN